MNIIIAPHPDDEIIGCYSLIKKRLVNKVIYIDPGPRRFERAIVAGRELGFSVCSLSFKNLCNVSLGKEFDPECTYLVPDVTDRHPLHQAINCIARQSICRLGYYTTDMVSSFVRELSIVEKERKKLMLDKYYPDQSSLWKSNYKYFLFEGIVLDFMEGI